MDFVVLATFLGKLYQSGLCLLLHLFVSDQQIGKHAPLGLIPRLSDGPEKGFAVS